MDFLHFLQKVQVEIEAKIGAGYHIDILEIPQNNGVAITGLRIKNEIEGINPVIHMESYFEWFQQGMTIDDIVVDIINAVRGNGAEKWFSTSQLFDFNQMKERIILRVINTETNRHMLDTVPNKSWLDLSVVYYLLLGSDTEGQMTTLISNQIAKEWGVETNDLYDIACENTKRLLPVNIRNLSEIILEILAERLGADFDGEQMELFCGSNTMPMYVLSNSTGLYGAGGMLPEFGIEDFAKELGKDLVVLPSSVHEVILVPVEEGLELRELSTVVKSINQTQVAAKDQLSDSIYYYSLASGMKQVKFNDNLPDAEGDMGNK